MIEREAPDWMGSIPLFAGLGATERERIGEVLVHRTYPKDTLLFAEGEPAEAVFILKRGQVRLHKKQDGSERTLQSAYAGDALALVEFLDQGPYMASARAFEAAEVAVLRRDDLKELVLSHPQVALRMMAVVAQHLRRVHRRLWEAGWDTTHRRLARTLLDLAHEHGFEMDDGWHVDLYLTRSQLASLCETTTEAVAQALRDFCRERAVVIQKRGLTITDAQRLRTWL